MSLFGDIFSGIGSLFGSALPGIDSLSQVLPTDAFNPGSIMDTGAAFNFADAAAPSLLGGTSGLGSGLDLSSLFGGGGGLDSFLGATAGSAPEAAQDAGAGVGAGFIPDVGTGTGIGGGTGSEGAIPGGAAFGGNSGLIDPSVTSDDSLTRFYNSFAPPTAGNAPPSFVDSGAVGGDAPLGGAEAGGGTGIAGKGNVSQPGFFDNILKSLSSNPLGVLATAGGLGASLMKNKGPQQYPGYNQIASNAAGLQTTGQELMKPLTENAPLPAGGQQAIDQALNSAMATIRSNYAAMGMTGSSEEAKAIASARQSAATQKFQMANALAQEGLQTIGASSGLYNNIMQTNMQSDQNLTAAISRMASALAGGSGRG